MIQTSKGKIDNLINSRKGCGLRCLLPSETSECHYGDYFRWDAWILVSKPSSKSDLSLVKRYSVVVPRMRTFEWYSRPDYAYTVLRRKMRLRSWAMRITRPEKKQPLMRLLELRRKSKVTCGAEIHCFTYNSFTFHAIIQLHESINDLINSWSKTSKPVNEKTRIQEKSILNLCSITWIYLLEILFFIRTNWNNKWSSDR